MVFHRYSRCAEVAGPVAGTSCGTSCGNQLRDPVSGSRWPGPGGRGLVAGPLAVLKVKLPVKKEENIVFIFENSKSIIHQTL